MASTKRNWPVGRGFERYYGFLGGETNQWYPDLVYDNHPVEQPALPEDGYHLTVDLTDKAIEFITDAKAIAPDKPFFMYFCPGATHAPHHAPKEWIEKYKGKFDVGYEAYREIVFESQKKLGIFPEDAVLSPTQPVRRGEERRRQALAAARRRAALGFALRRREEALLPHGRGVRRLPLAHRPRDRAAARLPRGVRPARQHDRRARLRQRRERRGRPERLRQREQVLQRDPGHDRGEPAVPRRARLARDLQPLPGRLGVGLQHAVQDVEALQLRGRRGRPDGHLLAQGDQGARASSGTSSCTPPTSSRRCTTCSGSSCREVVKGFTADPARGRQLQVDVRERRRADAEGERRSSRCSARGPCGTRAGRRSASIRRSPAGATSTRTAGSSTTPTKDRDRDERPGRREPGQAPGDDQPLVPPGRHVQGPAAARQDRGRGARRPDAAAGRAAARPLRLLPGRGRGAGDRRGERPQPQLLDRGGGGRRLGGRRRACSSPTARRSAATRST